MADFNWEELLEYIDLGLVIPIVGQELLRVQHGGREVAVESLIATRLAEQLGISTASLPAERPLHEIVCRHLSGPNRRKNVYAAMNMLMRELSLDIPAPLLQLAAIKPFNLFVTTTFDALLQKAIDQVRFSGEARTQTLAYHPRKFDDLPCERKLFATPFVYHLMGKLSAMPEYVLTDEDTLEFHCALQAKESRPRLLFDELRDSQLLLLGHNYPDWLTRFFLRGARGEKLSTTANQYEFMADRCARCDHSLAVFLERFSGHTQIYEEGDAVSFVNELHRRWLLRHPASTAAAPTAPASAAPFDAKEMPQGAVFVSYASEDLAAAKALQSALDAHGVDVWFDKRHLKGGDDFDAKIKRNIRSCSLFIPLISANTEKRSEGYFRKEWLWASERTLQIADGVPFIFPVSIDGTPSGEALVPEKFLKYQWTPLQGGKVTPEFAQLVVKLVRERRVRERGVL